MIFFYFDEISKMWAWEPKMSCWVLSEVIFWPKWSFCNRALLRFFMHMKTHFSTISFYLNLQINNFFKTARLMNISWANTIAIILLTHLESHHVNQDILIWFICVYQNIVKYPEIIFSYPESCAHHTSSRNLKRFLYL